jgi:hypothetical protein
LAEEALREATERAEQVARTKEMERQKRGDKVSSFTFNADEITLDGAAQLVAMGDRATLMLDESYNWCYTSGLATEIHKLLHTRARSHPRPTYVALGSMCSFYIQFPNEKSQWSGSLPNTLYDIVRHNTVSFVAFGASWDSYVVLLCRSDF